MKEKEREDDDTKEGVMAPVKNSREYIPLDLIFQILQRLPAKALLKFTSVTKTWCSEIRSQQFVDNFMSMSRPSLLLVFDLLYDGENHLFFFSVPHLPQESTDSSVVAKHEMTVSKTSPYGIFMINRRYVRGFICIDLNGQYMVCNPTTRQIITLPEKHDFDPDTMKCYMHLGYDQTNDQYKVLCIIRKRGSSFAFEHSVYTLGCRQSSSLPWRRVKSGDFNYYPCSKGVYIDGVYYGVKIERGVRSMIVAGFDFRSESLGQIKTPETLNSLTKYQGKLAGINFQNMKNSVHIWVLEDVKKQIWSKVLKIPLPDHPPATFSGITDAGELVFYARTWGYDDFKVLYIDINTKIMREVKIVGVTNHDEVRGRVHKLCHRYMSCDYVTNFKSFNLN